MISKTNTHPTDPPPQVEAQRFDRLPQRLLRKRAAFAASIVLLFGAPAAQSDDRGANGDRGQAIAAAQLRSLIGQQVGGIDKLKVPATNAEIPVPPGKPDEPDRYITTEAKRFLGKMLFHDPVRTARININQGQPVDLPAGTAFGGTVGSSAQRVQAVINATKQTVHAAPATSARQQARPVRWSICMSAPRAAATPTRTAISSSAGARRTS